MTSPIISIRKEQKEFQMFTLTHKIIEIIPCNNITYTGELAKYDIKRSKKNLYSIHNKENTLYRVTKVK